MVRYVFLSLNVLNGLLALAVAAVLHFAVIPVLNPVARISLPPMKGAVTSPSGEPTAPSQHLPVADYAVISEKNLFHPERRILPEKQAERAVPKPEVFLYGTLIAGDASYAFIDDKKSPHSTPGRGKRQTMLKKGDHLAGYILSEIEANRIVLVKGEEKIVVMLDDKGKRRTSEVPTVPTAPTAPAAARTAAGGITASPPPMPSSPQAGPSSLPAGASPGPGIASPSPRPSPQPSLSSSPQAMPASVPEAPSARPGGIGGSGTWPPTKSSIEQTRQKLQEGLQMRAGQIQRGK